MADRPATEPRTDADPYKNRHPIRQWTLTDKVRQELRQERAEAAQGAAPRDLDAIWEHVRVSHGCTHDIFRIGIVGNIPFEGAAPRAEGLDWDRLREAMADEAFYIEDDEGNMVDYDRAATLILARLSRPSDERVPEEER